MSHYRILGGGHRAGIKVSCTRLELVQDEIDELISVWGKAFDTDDDFLAALDAATEAIDLARVVHKEEIEAGQS